MYNNDFYGSNHVWFVGVVAERVDDTYVRVRIYGIHPAFDKQKVADSDLPLALVAYPVTGDQAGGGSPSHGLDVDSWVIGFFADYPRCQQPIVTHAIQGTSDSMSGYKNDSGEFVNQGPNSDNNTTDGTPPGNVDTTGTINLTGGSNIEKAYNFVYDKIKSEGLSGDPHILASAVCGVLMLETTGINPSVTGGYMGRAWGICQWLGTRRTQLFKKYGYTKRLDQQLDFMWWELNNTEKNAKRLWSSSTNLPDAVAGFCMFERAEECTGRRTANRAHSNYKKRLAFAYQVYNSIKHTATNNTLTSTNPRQPGV